MMTNFGRNVELVDNIETDYLGIIIYELFPMSCDLKAYQYSRFCTILEGCKDITINSDTHLTYSPGQFFFLPPYSSVHFDIDIRTRALVLEINDNLLKSVTTKVSVDIAADYNSLKENKFFIGDINSEINYCLNNINNILLISGIPEKNKKFLLDLSAQELVFYLIKIKGVQQVINLEYDHPIHKALKYIKENIKQPISISQLAYDLNMSETNFSNSFKKVMGTTPRVYITNLKLTQAKEMLKNKNVSEVANGLGFGDLSYFIALFKSKYGVTPKQYQLIGKSPVTFK